MVNDHHASTLLNLRVSNYQQPLSCTQPGSRFLKMKVPAQTFSATLTGMCPGEVASQNCGGGIRGRIDYLLDVWGCRG